MNRVIFSSRIRYHVLGGRARWRGRSESPAQILGLEVDSCRVKVYLLGHLIF